MTSDTKRLRSSFPSPPSATAGVLIINVRISTKDQKLDLQRNALEPRAPFGSVISISRDGKRDTA